MERDLVAHIEAAASEALSEALLEALRRVGGKIQESTPVEDGHAHTAWRSAFNKVPGVRFAEHAGESGDPTAVDAGEADYRLTGPQQHIRIKNGLDFVRKLEYGLEITPISPGGRKEEKVIRPPGKGRLYSPRSTEGRGVLVWEDKAGKTHRALSVTPPAGHYVENALRQAKAGMAKAHK